MAIPVCSGGEIPSAATSIVFTNSSTTTSYTITDCAMPGWPATDPVVPKAANGVVGSALVPLAIAAVSGQSYTYVPVPACTQGTPPKIKVQ